MVRHSAKILDDLAVKVPHLAQALASRSASSARWGSRTKRTKGPAFSRGRSPGIVAPAAAPVVAPAVFRARRAVYHGGARNLPLEPLPETPP